jgi:hypothetical protein
MNPEQHTPPQPPERKPHHEPPTFDLEQMSTEHIQLLNEALSTDADRFWPLLAGLERSFRELPASNVEKARELVAALAHSASIEDRCRAGYALGPLVHREQELDTEHLQTTLHLWVELLSDHDEDVRQSASMPMSDALREKTLRADVADWIRERLGD